MHAGTIGWRLLAVLTLVGVMAFAGGCASLGRPMGGAGLLSLIDGGRASAAIVVGDKPSAQAREAAAELRAFLKKMTGVELQMVDRATDAPIKILVGRSAASEQAATLGLTIPTGLKGDFNDEGYVVATGSDFVILAGNETEPYQGTFFAVYDFLHALGCRWYMPGEFGEVVPSLSKVVVEQTKRVVRPEFRVRDAWYTGYFPVTSVQAQEFSLWKRRNRYCRQGFWGSSEYLGNPWDDSTYRLLPKDTYFKTHPEYYSLNENGTRNDRFLCMSHPGAIEAAANTIVGEFCKRPDSYSYAFSPPDAPVLCNCPDCKPTMHGGYDREGYGEVSDPYFRFVFDLADRVGKDYPDKYVITMAYANRCRPPEVTNEVDKRRSNLLIQIASLPMCTLHSYASTNCPTRHVFLTMLKRWLDLAAGVVIYEYDPRDWSSLQMPLWRSCQMADDMRELKRLGGWGVSVEGKMSWLASGMNYYLRGRLSWDLATDPAAVEAEFCERFFGPAATSMLDYYRAISASAWNSRVHVIAQDNIAAIWSRPLLNECKGKLEQAERLAVGEPYKTRVAAFRGQFDRIDAYVGVREALARADYRSAADRAQQMIDAAKRVNNPMLLQDAQHNNETELSGMKQKEYCQKLAAWIEGLHGKVLTALPAEALFRTDPVSLGVIEQWYLPGTDLGEWQPLRMTTDWWSQGVAGSNQRSYQGIGWYRCNVTLPQTLPSRVEMYLPELKAGGVWVWCNGRFAGYLAPKKEEAIQCIDVSGSLRPGENTIVIRLKSETGFTLPPLLFSP